MENDIVCIGCGKQVSTKYCGNCGHIVTVKQSTILSLVSDFFSNLFSLQNSIPATFLKLLISPNKIIDNYYNGYRGNYPSPGKMVFFAFAIAAFHILIIDPNIWDIEFILEDNQYSIHLFLLLMSVLLISGTSYITFIRAKLKFVKHLISAIYLWSLFFTIFLIISDVILVFKGGVSRIFRPANVGNHDMERYRFYSSKETTQDFRKSNSSSNNTCSISNFNLITTSTNGGLGINSV